MSHWELLGISPCNDKKLIKRAYAKKLKTTRPEDSPEEFQLLNEAYQSILAELNAVDSSNSAIAPMEIDVQKTPVSDAVSIPTSGEQPSGKDSHQPERRSISTDTLLTDFQSLIAGGTEQQWQAFLSRDEFSDYELKQHLSMDFFAVLLKHSPDKKLLSIGEQYRHRLLALFAWQEQELALSEVFDSLQVVTTINQLASTSAVSDGSFIPPSATAGSNAHNSPPAEHLEIDRTTWLSLMVVVVIMLVIVLVYLS